MRRLAVFLLRAGAIAIGGTGVLGLVSGASGLHVRTRSYGSAPGVELVPDAGFSAVALALGAGMAALAWWLSRRGG